MAPNIVSGIKALFVRRVITIGVAAFAAAAFVVLLVRMGPTTRLPDISKIPGLPTTLTGAGEHEILGRCDVNNLTDALTRWEEAQKKYGKLRDDKFTIAIQTYKRPKELDDTLRVLLTDVIPSLHEIVIVWNEIEADPPANFKSEHGIPVRYRKSPVNSLNQRLWPDPEFQTQAVLLSDDDVYYKPEDLEFAFQSWRKFGKYRLTGALPRCANEHQAGKWDYTFCSKDVHEDNYAMIITNLAFSHLSFLDYYSSDDATMTEVRKYVDEHLNCEDIGMNFVASYLTGNGPLLVTGREKYVNYEPAEGISRKPGHLEARSKCLNDFTELFGCMPLRNETGHMSRGVVVL